MTLDPCLLSFTAVFDFSGLFFWMMASHTLRKSLGRKPRFISHIVKPCIFILISPSHYILMFL